MGFSASIGRHVAYARGQINGFEKFRHLLKSFELVFLVLTVGIVLCIYFGSNWIARSWIKSNAISPADISYCIVLMGLIIGLRFFSTIYRSGINGFEDQIWINKVTIVVSTSKYVGYFFILIYVSNDIRRFFEYQLLVGALEALCLGKRFYFKLPSFNQAVTWLKIDWSVFRKALPFTVGISYTSAILIMSSQFDKLILSGLLTLREFGYFSLVGLISGSLVNLATPVFLAYLPRLTMLTSKNNPNAMVAMYSNMTQIIAWIALSCAMSITMYSREIFYLLSGSKDEINSWHEILSWYVLGSCVGVLGTLQYYLQNALGTMRLYVIGSTLSFLVQAPLIYLVTMQYGALGAGKLWFLFNTIWFLGWTSIVHAKLLPGFHFKWLTTDFFPILTFVVAMSFLSKKLFPIGTDHSRVMVTAMVAVAGIAILVVTSVSVRSIRSALIERVSALL